MMTTSGSVSEIADAPCSSAISSARSRCAMRAGEKDHGVRREESKRKHVGSAHMRRRAEAILRLLSGGCSSEVRIRQVLGDSPDTSKALRM
ncbi:hypothetical protein L1049_009090 [Liquidambar formosana]|uniref:HTH three-helical bundle domain-containing protein n=1 Tax=Liquidambar formosana TaxID=63359 RepID=A0AAP0SAU9_LIQFO